MYNNNGSSFIVSSIAFMSTLTTFNPYDLTQMVFRNVYNVTELLDPE